MNSLNIISLGVGVQSTALYYKSSMGELPRCDYAVFADTGKEKKGTIDYLENVLLPWAEKNNGIPIRWVRKRNLYQDILRQKNTTNEKFVSIPAFTKNPDGTIGMLRRQCTFKHCLAVVAFKKLLLKLEMKMKSDIQISPCTSATIAAMQCSMSVPGMIYSIAQLLTCRLVYCFFERLKSQQL